MQSNSEEQKVSVMLAGPGHDAVIYTMQPPFLSDARLVVSATATQWSNFDQQLKDMKPDLLVVQAEIAPGPEALIHALARMQVWNGVAIVILSPALRDLRGSFEKVSVVRNVLVGHVNWAEVAQAGYGAVMTERAKAVATAPLQQAYLSRSASAVIGTRVVAFLSAGGGSGCSTLAENLGYELAVRMNVRTLLMSFNLPAAAAVHLNLRYVPNALEYFAQPGDGFGAAIQNREGLDVIMAPESSLDYQKAARYSVENRKEPASIYSLVMSSWTRNYAAVLLDLPSGEDVWSLQGIAAANTAVIVSRCTLADMAATRHKLVLLLERLTSEHRIPREAIYLVLNQVTEKSSFSPRGFHNELIAGYGWAPPVAAVIPYNPAIPQLQDDQVPPITRIDAFARSIRSLTDMLFPGMGMAAEQNGDRAKSRLRFPRFGLGA